MVNKKIHKPGVPIRPIVSYSGSPSHDLEYIADILKAHVKDENDNAKNSTTFFNYIRMFPVKVTTNWYLLTTLPCRRTFL